MDTILKKILLIAIVVLTLHLSARTAFAYGNWNIYAGGSIAHLCEKAWYGGDKLNYGWGGGAFIGGGYEFNFTSHWSLSPQLELAYSDNGAFLDNRAWDFYRNHTDWRDFFSINIPIIANFRFSLSEGIGLRFGAGPYLQEALYGRRYKYGSDIKEKMSGSIDRRFNVGIQAEAAVETGKHLSYMLRVQYPFLKEGWVRKTMILSAGVRYAF